MSPATTCRPDTRAAAPNPASAPPHTSRCAVSRRIRPAASGRPAAAGFRRSSVASARSLATLPAAPRPTPDNAAKARSFGTAMVPRAIHPPARTPAAAIAKLCPRVTRHTSVTQDVLVESLVLRDDPVGGEIPRAAQRFPLHRRVAGGILEQLDRP